MVAELFSAKVPSKDEIIQDPTVVERFLIELKETVNRLDEHYLLLNGGNKIVYGITFENTPLMEPVIHGTIEYSDGHFYISNGHRKVLVLSDGIIKTDNIITNTIDEISVYIHNFKPYEIHKDEVMISTVIGAYSNSSASDDFIVRVYFDGNLLHAIPRASGNVTDVAIEITNTFTFREEGVEGTFVHAIKIIDDDNPITEAHPLHIDHDTTKETTLEITIAWDNAKPGNIININQGYLQFLH